MMQFCIHRRNKMQQSETMLETIMEVSRRDSAARDLLANAKGSVRMIQAPDTDELMVILLKDGASELERFQINETAHNQIASKMGIPSKYYDRLCVDHPDLVCENVNKLFEREGKDVMLRTIDGKVRAFLSDRYKRIEDTLRALDGYPGATAEVVQSVFDRFIKQRFNR
jgi:hypothetical protein